MGIGDSSHRRFMTSWRSIGPRRLVKSLRPEREKQPGKKQTGRQQDMTRAGYKALSMHPETVAEETEVVDEADREQHFLQSSQIHNRSGRSRFLFAEFGYKKSRDHEEMTDA